MNVYAVGNQVKLLFAFTNRPLTSAEQAGFLSGQGLPAGVGVDQITVKLDWRMDGAAITTLSGGQITHDGVGQYHAIVTTATPGSLEYRGYSLDGSSNAVASTPRYVLAVEAF